MHTCHATNCKTPVPPAMFMCRRHWFSLPKRLRDRIWATYREGQEDDWQPSRAYCLTAIECVKFLAAKEGIAPDIKLYEVFMPEEVTQPGAAKE